MCSTVEGLTSLQRGLGPLFAQRQQIAYHSKATGNYEIYVLDLRSGVSTQVTSYAGIDQWPDWSPNGNALAIRRDTDIYVLDLATGDATRLTNLATLDQRTQGWCVWSRASGVGRRHDPCSSEQGDEVSPVARDREECPMKVLGKKRSRTEQVTDKVKEVVRDHPKGAAAAGLAAVTAAGAAAWLTKRSHGIADGTSFHVESDGNGAWLLKEDGVDEPVQRHATKREAISAAREYARKHNPSVLAIHREDGGVSKRHTYDDR